MFVIIVFILKIEVLEKRKVGCGRKSNLHYIYSKRCREYHNYRPQCHVVRKVDIRQTPHIGIVSAEKLHIRQWKL